MAYEKSITKPAAPVTVELPLTAGGVTHALVAPNAIESDNIKDGEVKGVDILDATITAADIGDGEVKLRHLGSDVVVGSIGAGGVGTPELKDASVTPAKLAPASVTDTKLADNSVDTNNLKVGSVDEDILADDSVIPVKIPDASVLPVKLDCTSAPTDGQHFTYDSASGKFKPVTVGAGGSAITWLAAPVSVYAVGNNADVDVDVSLAAVVPGNATAVIIKYWIQDTNGTGLYTYVSINTATAGGGSRVSSTVELPSISWPYFRMQTVLIPLFLAQTLFLHIVRQGGQYSEVDVEVIGYVV